MPREFDIKQAVVMGPRFMGVLRQLSELTGEDPGLVLKKAVAFYRQIKMKEREGYLPAVVKGGKATFLKEGRIA